MLPAFFRLCLSCKYLRCIRRAESPLGFGRISPVTRTEPGDLSRAPEISLRNSPTLALAILSEFTIPSVLYAKGLAQIAATRGSGTTSAGKLAATDTFAQSSYVQWQTTQYTDCCFAASQRVYKLIPASGAGTSGTNYDETDFGYDVMRTATESGLFARNQIATNLSAWKDHDVRTKRAGLVQRAEDWRSGSFNHWLDKPE